MTTVIAASGLLQASACVDSKRGSVTATIPAGRVESLLDDVDDGDGAAVRAFGRAGRWFTYADAGTRSGGTMNPRSPVDRGIALPELGGPQGGGFAMRFTGTLSGDAIRFAGLGLNFHLGGLPYDASRYEGLTFWAKAGASSMVTQLKVEIPDGQTDPDGGRCGECFNHFHQVITLTPEWRRYTIPFSALQQEPGWGDHASGLLASEVRAVLFQLANNSPANAEWDFSIDQVSLITADASLALAPGQAPPRLFAEPVQVPAFTAPLQPADGTPRTALVIGNGAYTASPLATPAADAELMAQTLRSTGFSVAQLTDATAAGMSDALDAFVAELSMRKGVGLFYFAGHAVQLDSNYLIAVGAEKARSASDLALSTLELSSVIGRMHAAGAETNIVIVDAGRDGSFRAIGSEQTRGLVLGQQQKREAGLAPVQAPAGMLVVYSAAPGKVALDGDGNSPFTRAFAHHALSPQLPIEQVLLATRSEVLEVTGGRQTPWESSSLRAPFAFQSR